MADEMDDLLDEIDSGPLAGPPAPPLSDEEHQQLMETLEAAPIVEAAAVIADLPPGADLKLLKPNEIPVVGVHYVVWGSPPQPYPVLVTSYKVSEDEHATMIHDDPNPQRLDRAEAYARWRYKGFISGQVDGT